MKRWRKIRSEVERQEEGWVSSPSPHSSLSHRNTLQCRRIREKTLRTVLHSWSTTPVYFTHLGVPYQIQALPREHHTTLSLCASKTATALKHCALLQTIKALFVTAHVRTHLALLMVLRTRAWHWEEEEPRTGLEGSSAATISNWKGKTRQPCRRNI